MNELYLRYKSIAVFSAVKESVKPLAELCVCTSLAERLELAAKVFARAAECGAESTGEWMEKLMLADDNAFSRLCARGERVPAGIKKQVRTELLTFKQLSLVSPENIFDGEESAFAPKFGHGGFGMTEEKLAAFYALNGCGALAVGNTFVYRDGTFMPTASDDVTLSDLKNYAEEKAEIVRNTENFIAGLPAFNALLYGDRGTGKSTTVRAIAHDYKSKLKVIEISRDGIDRLPDIKAALAGLKQKFILFVDDLSFDEDAHDAERFKAALEGSLYSGQSNTLLYCTSNRRHLFKETDKDGMRHRSDEVQAELALFDRFGLVITYITPDRNGFTDILKQILRSRGIKWRDEYAAVAELAAIKKGGRSPRAAKQIADLIESTYAEKRGE